MPYLVEIGVVLAVGLGVFVIGKLLADRPTHDQLRAVRRLRNLNSAAVEDDAATQVESKRSASEAFLSLGRWASKGKADDELRRRLSYAGYRSPSATLYFSGLQLALVIVLALGAAATALMTNRSVTTIAMAFAAGGAIGLLIPSFLLASRIRKRQRMLRVAMPDALDILVLSVEGGSTLSAAVNWLADEIAAVHPGFGEEIQVLQREIQLGLSVGDAFKSFAERCGLMEARDLAAALQQSERYGASVSKSLRTYADAARVERQTWAEEVAQKAAVKIIFPMLLCIFPAMFIVILGPAAMQMSKLMGR